MRLTKPLSNRAPERVSKIFFAYLIISVLACHGSSRRLFEQAKKFDESGDYNRAAAYYERVFELYPISEYAPRALFRAGIIKRLYSKDYQKSIQLFNTIILNYPSYQHIKDAQREIAEIFMEDLREYNNAISEYHKLLQLNPRSKDIPEYIFKIATCYEEIGNYDQAMIEYKNILEKFPQSPYSIQAKFKSSFINYLRKRPDPAIKGFEEFISMYPDSELAMDARFYLASSYADAENLQKAIEIFRELEGKYRNPEALKLKIERLEERLRERKR